MSWVTSHIWKLGFKLTAERWNFPNCSPGLEWFSMYFTECLTIAFWFRPAIKFWQLPFTVPWSAYQSGLSGHKLAPSGSNQTEGLWVLLTCFSHGVQSMGSVWSQTKGRHNNTGGCVSWTFSYICFSTLNFSTVCLILITYTQFWGGLLIFCWT